MDEDDKSYFKETGTQIAEEITDDKARDELLEVVDKVDGKSTIQISDNLFGFLMKYCSYERFVETEKTRIKDTKRFLVIEEARIKGVDYEIRHGHFQIESFDPYQAYRLMLPKNNFLYDLLRHGLLLSKEQLDVILERCENILAKTRKRKETYGKSEAEIYALEEAESLYFGMVKNTIHLMNTIQLEKLRPSIKSKVACVDAFRVLELVEAWMEKAIPTDETIKFFKREVSEVMREEGVDREVRMKAFALEGRLSELKVKTTFKPPSSSSEKAKGKARFRMKK